MDRSSHVRLMAQYNQWMNQRLYAAAATLPGEALAADRKAFFGSILATLNHLLNADIIWLKRFATHPANFAALAPVAALPALCSISELRATSLAGLAEQRAWLDAAITAFANECGESHLDHVLHYANLKGIVSERDFFGLLLHFFNHQTHHRGQVTTLLSQAGVDMGVTDLLVLVPDAVNP